MSTFREASKGNWTSSNSTEHINAGSLQRIADALETVSENYNALIADKKSAYESRDYWRTYSEKLQRRIRGLRGVITKLKSKIK